MRNFRVLNHSIKDEFKKLGLLDKEKNALLKRRPSNYLSRAGGSILHDFYTGIENIFERIAKEIDNRIPVGEEWHSELLRQMTLDIPGLRPQVITANTEKKLREYLGFHHLFRKRYGFELDWRKLKKLLLGIPLIRSNLENEIDKFFKTIESLSQRAK